MRPTDHILALFIGVILFAWTGHFSYRQHVILQTSAQTGDFCNIRNTAFRAGEVVQFRVFYTVIGAYIYAGDATFTTTLENYNNKAVYHVVGSGRTRPSFDIAYKVRDRYESYFDTTDLQPLRFIRDVNEGGYKNYETISFNRETKTAVTNKGVFKMPDCVQDVVSAMYYARNIDFNKYKPDDKIHFSMFLDHEVFNMYIRYLGKDTVRTQYGTFRAIKFKPLLLEGTVFEGGEKMTVWVSDDPNHVVLRVESPIVVGKVKIDMMGYKNLRHPLSSLMKRRFR